MSPTLRFTVFVLVSVLAFLWLLQFSMRRRRARPNTGTVLGITAIVVVGGMALAKYGHNAGLPWWIYYTVPALLTLLLPPMAFRMTRSEAAVYVLLAFLSSPVIHVFFSLTLGWTEYLPFLHVPSIRELLS